MSNTVDDAIPELGEAFFSGAQRGAAVLPSLLKSTTKENNVTDQATIEAEMLRVSAAEGDPSTEMPVKRDLLLRVMTRYQTLASDHGTEVTEQGQAEVEAGL